VHFFRFAPTAIEQDCGSRDARTGGGGTDTAIKTLAGIMYISSSVGRVMPRSGSLPDKLNLNGHGRLDFQ
jgi:hypothetical protein